VSSGVLMAGLSVSLFHPFHQTKGVHGRGITKASRNHATQRNICDRHWRLGAVLELRSHVSNLSIEPSFQAVFPNAS
jgi:hypothetical protein